MSNQPTHKDARDMNDTLAKSEAFVIKHKKQIIIGLVAFVVVVGAIVGYIYGYAQPREKKAQESLGIVMQTYIAQQNFELALKGEGKTIGLQTIASKYSGTKAGNLARGMAGICLYNLGKTKDAIKQLEDFSAQSDQTVSPQMIAALANCYAADKQLDKAVSTFKKAAKATDVPALASEYLLQAGLILENQKKTDEALKLYQDIKADYPAAPICVRQEQGGVVLDAVIDKYIERVSK